MEKVDILIKGAVVYAILDQSEKLFVVKDGRLIAEKGTINREFLV